MDTGRAVVELFSAEVIGVATTIRHTVEIAAWTVDKRVFAGQAAATSEWGTARRHAGELLDDALHSSIPTIWDIWRDADGEHREINAAETEAAKEKLAKIKAAFETWIWTDPDRTDRLARSTTIPTTTWCRGTSTAHTCSCPVPVR